MKDIVELRKLNKEKLLAELEERRKELSEYRDAFRTGKEKNSKKALLIRKNIARILSVLCEQGIEDSSIQESNGSEKK